MEKPGLLAFAKLLPQYLCIEVSELELGTSRSAEPLIVFDASAYADMY